MHLRDQLLQPRLQGGITTASGISALADKVLVGVYLDESFEVSAGVRSSLQKVVKEFNYGVVQMVPTGGGAEITPILAHEGNSNVLGIDVADLL